MVSISSLIAILSYAIALCGIVPLYPWLEPVPRGILLLGVLAGVWQDRRGAWPLKDWMLNVAVVPVFVYYALQFSRHNPAQPVVSVLAIMLAVRLGGLKSVRHYLQISALSLFCLASSSLFDLSPRFLTYLALMLFLVAVSLVLLTFFSQDDRMALAPANLRTILMAGVLMPLAALPLMLFFFPLLPRTQLPLWNFLAAPASRVSGFSEKVEPGNSPNAGESRVLAFRAEMPRQPQQQLYWRGTVFNRIEGQRWVRAGVPGEEIQYTGPRISQTIYPEPSTSRTLLALDAPALLMLPRTQRYSDGVYEWQGPRSKRLTYNAWSQTSGRLPTKGGINRSFYLKRPEQLPVRIRQLAADIRSRGISDARRLEQLETYFRNGGFRYSMHGLPTGDHALEEFLFVTKQGHCEFFASAFALILREAGVPARLVGGYLGGEYNELGGYYLVSEDMAHVWVEAYIGGQGWLRIDPSSFAQNAGAVWGGTRQRSLLLRMRLTLDSLDHAWNRTVISYDFERQIELASGASQRIQGIKPGRVFKKAVPYLAVLCAAAGVYLLLTRRKRLFPSREERLLRGFYRCIERDCGIAVQRGRQGVFELADSSGHADAQAFAHIYARAVYHDRRLTDEEHERLKLILRRGFRAPPA